MDRPLIPSSLCWRPTTPGRAARTSRNGAVVSRLRSCPSASSARDATRWRGAARDRLRFAISTTRRAAEARTGGAYQPSPDDAGSVAYANGDSSPGVAASQRLWATSELQCSHAGGQPDLPAAGHDGSTAAHGSFPSPGGDSRSPTTVQHRSEVPDSFSDGLDLQDAERSGVRCLVVTGSRRCQVSNRPATGPDTFRTRVVRVARTSCAPSVRPGSCPRCSAAISCGRYRPVQRQLLFVGECRPLLKRRVELRLTFDAQAAPPREVHLVDDSFSFGEFCGIVVEDVSACSRLLAFAETECCSVGDAPPESSIDSQFCFDDEVHEVVWNVGAGSHDRPFDRRRT